jgi:O-acetyl-ADP-ribose deacetylase (regulator of RNase III)
METKHCDILKAREEYICHQCNCVSHGAAGLAAIIFANYSYADCYSTRWEPDKPGTIHLAKGYDPNEPNIINMFAQYNPGKAREDGEVGDTEEHRKKYFLDCLRAIKKLNPKSLAMPHKIGCGLAGGDHTWYYKAIEKFEESTKITIVMYDNA